MRLGHNYIVTNVEEAIIIAICVVQEIILWRVKKMSSFLFFVDKYIFENQ